MDPIRPFDFPSQHSCQQLILSQLTTGSPFSNLLSTCQLLGWHQTWVESMRGHRKKKMMGFEYWDLGKKWRYQGTLVEGNGTLKLSKNK